MRTVLFETYNEKNKRYFHSFNDLDLILNKKTIGAATPKTVTEDIPFGDGMLDYTDMFGVVTYNNRTLTFECSIIGAQSEFLNKYSRLQNLLNGRKMKVTLSDDPDWYYVGRVTVNDWKSDKNIGRVVISVDAEPYKLKHALTVITRTVTGSPTEGAIISCHNTKMRVIPKITMPSMEHSPFKVWLVDGGNANVTTVYYGAEYTPFVFEEGENVIKVLPMSPTYQTVIQIEYREGSL